MTTTKILKFKNLFLEFLLASLKDLVPKISNEYLKIVEDRFLVLPPPLWGHNSVNFHRFQKFEQFWKEGIIICNLTSKFVVFDEILGFLAPNLNPHISVKNEDGGSNKEQLKGLEKFFPIMPRQKFHCPQKKSGPPLKWLKLNTPGELWAGVQ